MAPCPPELGDTSRIIATTGGFLGGSSMLLYMRPKNIPDAIVRIVVAVIAAAMLSDVLAEKLFGESTSQAIMGTAFVIGFTAWNVLGATAKFFENRQNADIVDMAKDVNSARTPPNPYTYNPPPPVSRAIDNPEV